MPAPQKTVLLAHPKAYAGQVAYNRLIDQFTGVVDDNDDVLQHGDFVTITGGADSGGWLVKKTVGVRIDGVVVFDYTQEGKIKKGTTVSVLRKGVIWLDKTRNVSGTITALGNFHFEASSNKLKTGPAAAAGDLTVHGPLVLLNSSGDLWPLEVNLPAAQAVHSG